MNLLEGRFRRIDAYESGTFEEDLLVMHAETLDIIGLNPTAAALWEALKWPQSVESLTNLLTEAFPSEKEDVLKAHVREVMQTLLSRKLLVEI